MATPRIIAIAGQVNESISISKKVAGDALRLIEGVEVVDYPGKCDILAVDRATFNTNDNKVVKDARARNVVIVNLDWLKKVVEQKSFTEPEPQHYHRQESSDSGYRSREGSPADNTESEDNGQDQAPRPVQNEAPRPVQNEAPRPVQNEAPRPVQNEAPRPVQDQAPRPVQDRRVEDATVDQLVNAVKENDQAVEDARRKVEQAEAGSEPAAVIEELKKQLQQKKDKADIATRNAYVVLLRDRGPSTATGTGSAWKGILATGTQETPAPEATEKLNELEIKINGVKTKGKILGLVEYYILVVVGGGVRGRRQLYVVKQSEHRVRADAYYRQNGTLRREDPKHYKDMGIELEDLNIMCVGQGSNRTYIYAAPKDKAVLFGITDLKSNWSSARVQRVLNEVRDSVGQDPLTQRKTGVSGRSQAMVVQAKEGLEVHFPS